MNSELLFSPEFWERTPSEVQAALHALDARVAALEATVQQLREQRQQDSRTSSRSPSSDPPQALTKRPRREPTGRRPGGQPGHEGQARGVVPVEEGDVVLPVKPEHCRRCQRPLQGEDAQPQRHQMTEIPTVKPVVTEYQLHQLVCPACGEATRAEWPPGVSQGGIRPAGSVAHGAVHGGLSSIEADHPERPGEHGEPGAGDRPGDGRARGRGAGLGAGPAGRASGRNGRARRAAARLAVDSSHHQGHGLCGTVVAPRQGGAGTRGGTLLGLVGDRSLERLHLVSNLAAAPLLGALAA
jgi:uncharacterized protein DUF6444